MIIANILRIAVISVSVASLAFWLWLRPDCLEFRCPGNLDGLHILVTLCSAILAVRARPHVCMAIGAAGAIAIVVIVSECYLRQFHGDWYKLVSMDDILLPPLRCISLLVAPASILACLAGHRLDSFRAVYEVGSSDSSHPAGRLDYASARVGWEVSTGLLWQSGLSAVLGVLIYFCMGLSDLRRLTVLLLAIVVPIIAAFAWLSLWGSGKNVRTSQT